MRKGSAYQVCEAAVGGTNLAVQRDREEDVVKGIDEVAVALLRTRDDIEELVELLLAGRNDITLFDAANQAAQLRDFLGTLPRVQPEENN